MNESYAAIRVPPDIWNDHSVDNYVHDRLFDVALSEFRTYLLLLL